MTYQGLPDIDADDFSFFQQRILSLSGIYLATTKQDLLRSRLIGRLSALGMSSIKEYRRFLGNLPSHDSEWQLLVNQITTNKTDFFREPAHFKYLTDQLLPDWVARNPHGKLRIWSAACSTGEEPYTLAMVLDRAFHGQDRFEILASDIDTKVLAQAENGVYPLTRLDEIPPIYQDSGIIKGQGEVKRWFKIKKSIHSRIRFTRVNLIELGFSSLGKFDLIFCRNVFIYFQPETVDRILGGFTQVLDRRGTLILGHSESLRMDPQIWTSKGPSVYVKDVKASPGAVQTLPTQASKAHTVDNKQAGSAPARTARKKRVLIIDDSVTIRQLLTVALNQSPQLEVVAAIGDPRETEAAIRQYTPDVITLDIKMPHLDGCQVLEMILPRFPIPTVMISALNLEDGGHVLRALELGAVDYIQKPTLDEIKTQASSLADRVYEASTAKVHRIKSHQTRVGSKKSATAVQNSYSSLIAVGSSTGGVQALTEILTQLPEIIPPILIVQHMPPVFSKAFADRLNTMCPFTVKEAADGDLVQNNMVLIGAGAKHMVLEPSTQGFCVRLTEGAPVNRHKPSVDVLFQSVAQHLGKQAIGVILTGMGSDGAKGLKKMKDKGARTIAQDEASCAVFGMPREAINLGAADQVCSLDQIPKALMSLLQTTKEPKRA